MLANLTSLKYKTIRILAKSSKKSKQNKLSKKSKTQKKENNLLVANSKESEYCLPIYDSRYQYNPYKKPELYGINQEASFCKGDCHWYEKFGCVYF